MGVYKVSMLGFIRKHQPQPRTLRFLDNAALSLLRTRRASSLDTGFPSSPTSTAPPPTTAFARAGLAVAGPRVESTADGVLCPAASDRASAGAPVAAGVPAFPSPRMAVALPPRFARRDTICCMRRRRRCIAAPPFCAGVPAPASCWGPVAGRAEACAVCCAGRDPLDGDAGVSMTICTAVSSESQIELGAAAASLLAPFVA